MTIFLSVGLVSRDFMGNVPFTRKISEKDYIVECDAERLSLPGAGGPTVAGLLGLLDIPRELDATFVIINEKIAFSDVSLADGDRVEILPSVSGG